MKKYKGYIVPANLTKDFILGSLENGYCNLSLSAMDEHCGPQATCDGCLLNIYINHTQEALIEYVIEEKIITKGEALKIVLDKNLIRCSN